ncbi:RNA polymerase sigma factor [Paracoccus xiamenensis]|uniref:RNA polymerase sigma factor n=1 Tax=Paracoccus xiamenensis TaxID=2714901 RepID=UPI0014073527|nr:sigma-70 family RNA polymerase sigma factor [Paracoccus xiamenensis]NHF74741.1 sigma-70 family RNA polymerase sigma factor [Paracoccus xiamenensis]
MVWKAELRHEIYRDQRVRLIEYATPILGSRELAEDVVQDAFMRFAPERSHGTTPEQILAYLYRIVRNLSFDKLKRSRIEQRYDERSAPYWVTPTAPPTPEENLLLGDQVRIVNEVLAEFPPEVRIAVEMNRFGGFTLEEVAAHLHISVATAHRHIRKVMVALALRLDRRD